MNVLRIAARAATAGVFVAGGIDTFSNPSGRAQLAKGFLDRSRQVVPLPDNDEQMVKANAVVQVVAGSTLALGIRPRLSAMALAGSLVPTTIGGHAFWEVQDPQARAMQQTQFLKNLSILGGLIYIAGTRT